ncbi:hypothetical protein AUEXF2481DRAFT_463396 [Aureobasidium subglaciale EXF-2481]|uniref:Uncharacterized protein n=1 Tax=Aureobasidium subglaciale (strain EXF-2481) TaxID=1043005 RepID=A0A074Y1I2_AURSE|nr:uncharacterized protein AUEXF2481DRAFT_463396 [Aureobasidium subglaciale EXF-2481]KEQ91623.1 hypothetical protein AUEXF2481DRAFT_463396 [Aureobasidium subglaciale EXF-2481]
MRAMAVANKLSQQRIVRVSKSFEGLVPLRSPVLTAMIPSPTLPSPTPLDWPLPANKYSEEQGSKLSDGYFGMNNEKRMTLSPVERQLKVPIEICITRSPEPSTSDYEPRERSRQQSRAGSRRRLNGYESNIVDAYDDRSLDPSSNESLIDEAKRLANEYHALFNEDTKSHSNRKHSASSNSIKEKMKLVPQPLFFNPRQISRQRELEYQRSRNKANVPLASVSPMRNSASRERHHSPKGKERALNFPYKLSLTPESTGVRRRSTSGSIPISPPFPGQVFETNQTKNAPSPVKCKQSIDDSDSFSAFYQRINADAEQLAREHNKPESKVTFEMNTLPSILSNPSDDTSKSFQESNYARRKASNDSGIGSVALSKGSRAPLKILTDKVTSVFGHHVRKSSITAIGGLSSVIENIKQRRPSFPIIGAPQPISAAEAYNPVRLQSTSTGLTVAKRRPSVFAGIKDHRRESKANKRREDLRRTIKMVPTDGTPVSLTLRKGSQWL